jgi:hypothetical protein
MAVITVHLDKLAQMPATTPTAFIQTEIHGVFFGQSSPRLGSRQEFTIIEQ